MSEKHCSFAKKVRLTRQANMANLLDLRCLAMQHFLYQNPTVVPNLNSSKISLEALPPIHHLLINFRLMEPDLIMRANNSHFSLLQWLRLSTRWISTNLNLNDEILGNWLTNTMKVSGQTLVNSSQLDRDPKPSTEKHSLLMAVNAHHKPST